MTSVTDSSAKSSAGPLDGVRVVELGALIAGPFAGRMLADFGADVIKVESPISADPFREWGRARQNGKALWWAVQARNKKAVTLDLKSDDGKRAFESLIETADVLIENFRPGTLERLGLAPERLHELNRGLVIARVSGYGQSGPKSALPGYAAIAEAVGGLRHLNGFPGGPPPRTGISLGDSLGALFAVQGILMALHARGAQGGRGQVVDVSLVESCFALLESALPDYAANGHVPGPNGTSLEGIAPSNIYHSADDKWVVIAANQDTVFKRLCDAMGMSELAIDERFRDHVARGSNQKVLDELIGEWAGALPAAEILDHLDSEGVPNSLVNTIADIVEDEHFREREMFLDVVDHEWGSVTHPGVVPKLSNSPGNVRWNGPSAPGQDNAEVLGALGFTEQTLAEWAERKVI
ncbi:MAG: CoA transferase [Cryobacterium sp.]|nr:CoA transferase [Cryobacterium sp.]